MSVRSDVTVDWTQSPRIITVAAPSTTIALQDLNDTLRSLEVASSSLQYPSIVSASGKDALGGGLFVGVTLTLLNALLAFAARGGPSFTQCTTTGGNLLATDVNGNVVSPISPTAFTQIVIVQTTSAGLISPDFTQTDRNTLNAALSLGQFVALK